jgi:hypothetical protein
MQESHGILLKTFNSSDEVSFSRAFLQNYKAKLTKIIYFLVMELYKTFVKEEQIIEVSVQNFSQAAPVNIFLMES